MPCPGVALSRHARCASGLGNLVRKGFLAFDTSATAYLYSGVLPAEQVAGRPNKQDGRRDEGTLRP
jgi:hypothetical protein